MMVMAPHLLIGVRFSRIVPMNRSKLLEEDPRTTQSPPSHHARDPVTLYNALQRLVVDVDLCELDLGVHD